MPLQVTEEEFKASLERDRQLRLAPAALLMGGSIVAMHYVGMAAMRMNAVLSYQPVLVALSVVVAVAAVHRVGPRAAHEAVVSALLAHARDRGVSFERTVGIGRQALFVDPPELEQHRAEPRCSSNEKFFSASMAPIRWPRPIST